MHIRILAIALLLFNAPLRAQVEMSTIAVPIETTLHPLLPLIEKQVPKSYEESRSQAGFSVHSTVIRDPIRLAMAGARLNASTIARYSLEACRRPLGCLGCGTDGEELRAANITLSTQFSWDENWRLRSTTTAQPLEFPNRCEITALNFDITTRFIAPLVEQQLAEVAKAIDRNTPNLTNIRPNAEKIWQALQEPMAIADRTWLVFEPLDAGLAPLTGQDMNVTTTLSLNATTRVIIGDKPATRSTPLPALQTRSAAGGLRVPLDLHIGYADASALANQQFGGRSYKLGEDDLRIEAITIVPGADGKLGVDANIEYRGGRFRQYTGPVHLEGTPRIDETNRVTIPDLDYALDSAHKTLFLRAVEGLAHDLVRDRLRQSATFSLAGQAEAARTEITKALTRQLAPGVRLKGQANAVQARSVTTDDAGLVVRVLVTGSAGVEMR